MPLPQSAADELQELLFRASALVDASGRHGTAFFVGRRHFLTCHHVVMNDSKVDIAVAEKTGPCTVIDSDSVLDLALLRAEDDRFDDVPAVVFDNRVPRPGDEIVSWGFPVNKVNKKRQAKRVHTDETSEWRAAVDGAVTTVEFDEKRIQKGMSGAAALNRATGGVCAVLRYSYDPGSNEGGGAIPIAVALRRFDVLQKAFDNPPPETNAWQQALGLDGLRLLGRDPTGTRMGRLPGSKALSLELAGGRHKWEVSLEGCPPVSALSDFEGADVVAALFSWAQRRGSLGGAELELLGRMLFRALMPQAIEDSFVNTRAATVGPTILRLSLDDAPDLYEIPWEYARQRNGEALSTDERLAFVRVVRPAAVETTPPAPDSIVRSSGGGLERRIRVLTVVSQPKKIERDLSERPVSERPWPKAGTLVPDLKLHIGRSPEIEVVEDGRSLNPSLTQLRELIDDVQASGGIDVLHLAGFGRTGRRGDPEFAFQEQFDEDAIQWLNLALVIEAIVRARPPTVLVVQLGFRSSTPDEDPLSLAAFRRAMDFGVLAVVGAGRPLHFDLFRPFNTYFYAKLAEGKTVEVAAQSTRNQLLTPQLGDSSLYGIFEVYTPSTQQDIRLAEPRPSVRPETSMNIPGGPST